MCDGVGVYYKWWLGIDWMWVYIVFDIAHDDDDGDDEVYGIKLNIEVGSSEEEKMHCN